MQAEKEMTKKGERRIVRFQVYPKESVFHPIVSQNPFYKTTQARRSLLPRYMGCHWYTTSTCYGYGIMIRYETIEKKYFEQGGDFVDDDARGRVLRWMLPQIAPGFQAISVKETEMPEMPDLVFITNDSLRQVLGQEMSLPALSVVEPEFNNLVTKRIYPLPSIANNVDDELTRMATILTPNKEKLAFAPGLWIVQASVGFDVEPITTPEVKTEFDLETKDCTFEVGPDKESVEVNRAWIGSKSDTLHRLVYGSREIVVDPSKPVGLPQLSTAAVKEVFERLQLDRPFAGYSCYQSWRHSKSVSMELYEACKEVTDYFMLDFHHMYLVPDIFEKESANGIIY